MIVLTALFDHDRTRPGVLRGERVNAPCFGKSDNGEALARGNPSRDPLKPYGDTPCGYYAIEDCVEVPEALEYRFGPWKLILRPLSGDALTANRPGIELHGGGLRAGELRPTYGCARTTDAAMEQIHEDWESGHICAGDLLLVQEFEPRENT